MNESTTLQQLLAEKISAKTISQLSFEQGLQLLETLVSQVESGTLSLEDAMRAYERGSLLTEHLRTLLTGAEEKLKVLSRKGTE